MSDAKEVFDRIMVICQETWDRLTQAMARNEPPRLTEWPMTRPSQEELIDAVVDGALFDGLARRLSKESVNRMQTLALESMRLLHATLLQNVQRWAEACEWNNAGEPTEALRKAARVLVSLIAHGGELRGSCHRNALDTLSEMLWEARRRGCAEAIQRAVCDEILHRESRGLMSRIDTIMITEEMEKRDLNPEIGLAKSIAAMIRKRDVFNLDVILKEEPNFLAYSRDVGRHVVITWATEDEPYHVSRDPLNGPAQEVRNLANERVQAIYVWNNQFLGRGDESFDLVLERFAEDFPKDFATSVERWTGRMEKLRAENPSRFETEAARMAEAASHMTPIHGERIRQSLEKLGVDLGADATFRL